MSQLFVITRPALVPGFHLAGVNAHAAEDAETAQELIEKWMVDNETGLIAIDDGLLARMDADFLGRLASSERLLYMSIPSRQPRETNLSRTERLAALMRRATGFHLTIQGNEETVNK